MRPVAPQGSIVPVATSVTAVEDNAQGQSPRWQGESASMRGLRYSQRRKRSQFLSLGLYNSCPWD